jgi:hypothetical protein
MSTKREPLPHGGCPDCREAALRHNYALRTEAERSERDKHAEPARAKWLRALQPTDTEEK